MRCVASSIPGPGVELWVCSPKHNVFVFVVYCLCYNVWMRNCLLCFQFCMSGCSLLSACTHEVVFVNLSINIMVSVSVMLCNYVYSCLFSYCYVWLRVCVCVAACVYLCLSCVTMFRCSCDLVCDFLCLKLFQWCMLTTSDRSPKLLGLQ